MRSLILIFSILFTLNSYAVIGVLPNIDGASATRLDPLNNQAIRIILGGIADANNVCDDSLTGTCDSCIGNNFPCNNRAIVPGTLLTFRFNYTAGAINVVSEPFLEMRAVGGDANVLFTSVRVNSASPALIDPGTNEANVEFTVRWGDICEITTDDTCNTPGAFSIRMGLVQQGSLPENVTLPENIDRSTDDITIIIAAPDNDESNYNEIVTGNCNAPNGICNFAVFPGDEQLHLTANKIGDGGGQPQVVDGKNLIASDGDVANSSVSIAITGIRAYFKEETSSTPPFADFDVGDEGVSIRDMSIEQGTDNSGDTANFWDFTDTDVTNLVNGTTYSVRLAITDEAGNHMYLTQFDTSGTHSAAPDEVIGLLAEDLNCFIATAAYGSILDKRIDTFRSFRNQVMNKSLTGKRLIQAYYKYGKEAAEYIKQNKVLLFMARTALWPALGFAHLSLKIGFYKSLVLSFLGLILLAFGTLSLLNKRRSNV